MHQIATLSTILALLLAGCSDGGSKPAEDIFDDLPSEPVEAGKGVIRGLVLDDAITPVEGAAIRIVSTALQTTTNADGAFLFSNLDPGTYFLAVGKPGWTQVQQSATVVAGVDRPDIVKVQIVRVPGLEPRAVPMHYHGFVSCGFLVGTSFVGGAACTPFEEVFGENDATHHFPVDAAPATYLQSELVWEENQPGGDRLTLTTYVCDLEGKCSSSPSDGQRMCQIWGPSPRVCQVTTDAGTGNPDGTGGGDGLNATGFGTGTSPGFNTWIAADCAEIACVPGTAAGVGAIIDQEFDVFNHVFYNFTPPEGWLFITDGPPQVPG